MSRPWVLDSFDDADSVSASPEALPGGLSEDERLQAFDQGYKDGWDDAARAHAEEQGTISDELAANLQAMSFTYHEARGAVLNEMEEILKGVVERVLPRSLVHSLGQTLIDRIRDVSSEASNVEVQVCVNPDNAERIRELFQEMVTPPLNVMEESTLGDGQAYLRFNESEQKIDLEAVLQELSDAVSEFFEKPDQPEMLNA
ncbi:hypothetical protein [Aliiruegeria sabulilitoris]|uniref:FliH/SctL family protein n=1 Tax=Aliiruegeria sabulilitoris TaxID=1510458 RepID=UPI0008306B30|nr:hypothetical protein [Aliiruegeria sabulilitoris]NDR58376.1 hypothetical protein [Pseudoruegeria sp. M32A2M]